MEPENKDVVEIDIKGIFFALMRKAWIIIIFAILGAVGAGAFSEYLIQPVYTSTTKVYVINRQEGSNVTLTDLQTGTQLTKDYMILVKSRPVIETVIKNLGLHMTSGALAGLITVNAPEDTRILEITVKNHDPLMAKNIADSMAEVSAGRMVSIMGIERVNIMEEGNLPTVPVSPNVKKNIILGVFLGFAPVCIIIALAYIMDDNIRTTDDIEKYLNLTALGMLPVEEGSNDKIHKKGKKPKRSRLKRKAA